MSTLTRRKRQRWSVPTLVLAKVAVEVTKRAITYGSRFARSDKAAWNKLYTGFPKYVKKGTRQGFIVGSSIGGLIKGTTDLSDNGLPRDSAIPSKFSKYPSGKQYQAYNRYSRSTYGRRKKCKCYSQRRTQRGRNYFRSR